MAAQPKPITSVFVWLTVLGLLLTSTPTGRRVREVQETLQRELSSHELAAGLLSLDGRVSQTAPSFKLLKTWDLPFLTGSSVPLSLRPVLLRSPLFQPQSSQPRHCPSLVGTIELRV